MNSMWVDFIIERISGARGGRLGDLTLNGMQSVRCETAPIDRQRIVSLWSTLRPMWSTGVGCGAQRRSFLHMKSLSVFRDR